MTPERTDVFRKHDPSAPAGFFAAEAAGLAWLAEAEPGGGVPVVDVVEVGDHEITLRRVTPQPPSRAAAEEFGHRLALTHAYGADWFCQPPPGWAGSGFIGPLPLPLIGAQDRASANWAGFYAEHRVLPYLRAARDRASIDPRGVRAVEEVCRRLSEGDEELAGPAEPPARIHGDLWSGNVLWSVAGAVLIDPAAHGGHRETDLAMLDLFGLPHLDRVRAAYHETRPLAPGWRDRVGVHQLHPLLVHAVLFGGGYGAQATQVARRYT